MRYILPNGIAEVRKASNSEKEFAKIDPIILRALLKDYDQMASALERIARTTGRNGHTATNIINLAKSVIDEAG